MIRAPLSRFAAVLALAAIAFSALAPAAMAADGVGLWGRTDDRVVTFWGLGVLAFFTVLVVVLSFVQMRLETRKERARRDLERLGRG